MALSLFSRKNRIINIVINDYSIRFVELKQSNPLSVHRWGERFIPFGIVRDGKIIDHDTLETILEECITDWKIQKRSVRFIVPDSFVIIRKANIPVDVKDDEINGYLYLELGTSIHLPFDEPVFDTYIVNKNKDNKEVLIFAAQEENILDYSSLFTNIKLAPVAADISPLSLYRLYDRLGMPAKDERLLMIHFDLNMVNLCIFENQLPLFMHHLMIDFDEDQWTYRTSKIGMQEIEFNGELEELSFQLEDIYKEISKFMDFYRYSINQGKQHVSKILLNGDHPYLDLIEKEIQTRFEIPHQIIHLATEDNLPRSHYLTLGLALKEV
ncbi:pilus assembly protein PilM [Bacillus sp. DTU_2020_1000418_1_SI_GHA_SEK_038]|uniref:type IV pilus biogenesis protein PilM n=1 Tax=Bacillus sp. DTU_2020_1000418_1_SI_GHA_SEK_038 TaxID=3077585 RepID=UPI0028EED84D|nr:pilus assembly protein PilM [Bacillus sp. DTU_2020_1000418_1_SI_GHA_SEK_038]WNS74463.1 pilus assembly protein PilM [Bacillus sp. DTU_2020_1000418_1_SI_GHA_SEK_038]